MRSAIILIILALALPGQSHAGTYEDATEAYFRGDRVTALSLIFPLAAEGDVAAQTHLGILYEFGQGIPQNYAQAARWYRLAAEQGDAFAQHRLGIMYENGLGMAQDHAAAGTWYRLSAIRGYAGAQLSLGYLYRSGKGIPKNYHTAIKLYRLAADQGNAEAQIALAEMYDQGLGIPQSCVQAHEWYNLAASNFPASDSARRAVAVEGRQRLAARMTSAQIAEAEKLATDWRPTIRY